MRIKIWRLEFAAKDPDNLAKQFSLIFRGNKPINGCAPFHAVAALRQRQDFMILIRSYRPLLQKLLDYRPYVPLFSLAKSFELMSSVIMNPFVPLNSNALSPVR